VRLSASETGTKIDYDYAVTVSGTAAAVGGRLLDGAAGIIIGKFFEGLTRHVGRKDVGAESANVLIRLWHGVLSMFGRGK
jgi:2-furoyl-CoA dehydrogenase large subunit